jgi:hypothetical protein
MSLNEEDASRLAAWRASSLSASPPAPSSATLRGRAPDLLDETFSVRIDARFRFDEADISSRRELNPFAGYSVLRPPRWIPERLPRVRLPRVAGSLRRHRERHTQETGELGEIAQPIR